MSNLYDRDDSRYTPFFRDGIILVARGEKREARKLSSRTTGEIGSRPHRTAVFLLSGRRPH